MVQVISDGVCLMGMYDVWDVVEIFVVKMVNCDFVSDQFLVLFNIVVLVIGISWVGEWFINNIVIVNGGFSVINFQWLVDGSYNFLQ